MEKKRRRAGWVGMCGLVLGMVACSSSTPADPGADAAGGGGDDASTRADGAVTARDATLPDGAVIDVAVETPDEGITDASQACIDYCNCIATNCPDKSFPTGCLHDCVLQTKWDLTCRTAHCKIAPAQPANGHCDHAVGLHECLDTP